MRYKFYAADTIQESLPDERKGRTLKAPKHRIYLKYQGYRQTAKTKKARIAASAALTASSTSPPSRRRSTRQSDRLLTMALAEATSQAPVRHVFHLWSILPEFSRTCSDMLVAFVAEGYACHPESDRERSVRDVRSGRGTTYRLERRYLPVVALEGHYEFGGRT